MPCALRQLALGLSLFCLLVSTAVADVPHTINFQGRLKDSTGTPYSGSKLVKFSIYDSLGVEIWTSGFSSQTFSGGLVNVLLGSPPQPSLPTAAIQGDTSLTLGITVDTDPEITPRFPFSSTAWAMHAGDADRVDGYEGSSFVQEAGDTMSGSLAVMGNLSVGTDTSYTGLSVQSGSNWSWFVNDGWGDFRIGDEFMGFSIGVALGGGGAGTTRMWSRGGVSEDICFGGPTWGDMLCVKSTVKQVSMFGDVGIGTQAIVAPLTLRSQNRSRWDVGSGLGDFRLDDGSGGLSIGVDGTGDVAFWSSGGTSENLMFGSPTHGEILSMLGSSGTSFFRGPTWWTGTNGSIAMNPNAGQMTIFGGYNLYPKVELWGLGEEGIMNLYRDSLQTVRVSCVGTYGGGGEVFLYREGPGGAQVPGAWLEAGPSAAALRLFNAAGIIVSEITANGLGGNAAAKLPDSSISALEIGDEPGIAFKSAAPNLLLLKSGTAQDFVTVGMNIPTDGYVTVQGTATIRFTGTTGTNFAWLQIDTTAGGSAGAYVWTGESAHASTGNSYLSSTIEKVYFLPAGIHTFRLEGNAYASNDALAATYLSRADLKATFYSTSYGAVTSLVSASGEFRNSQVTIVTDPQTNEIVRSYEVDLRELELKASRAREELERAQRELLEAQLREQTAANARLQQASSARLVGDDRR